jgi:ubiquinone/menaquinone biosynthesis C-methylase UbiE
MTARLSNAQIYDFWNRQATEHQQSPAASWSDFRVMEMEIEQISQRLSDGDRVLDVGCANGFSSVQFAARHGITLRGLDYIPRMIDEARERAKGPVQHCAVPSSSTSETLRTLPKKIHRTTKSSSFAF